MKPANLLISEQFSKNFLALSSLRRAALRVSIGTVLILSALNLAGLSLSGCVTVNVILPESAVQQATDDYVRELYKVKDRKTDAKADKTSGLALPQLINDAVASEVVAFKLDSKAARAILAKQAGHLDELHGYKESGALGETQDGKIVVKDATKIKAIQKDRVAKLLSSENELRTELFKEAKNTSHPDVSLDMIKRSFATSFQKYSPKGTWLESDSGEWIQKP